MKQRIDSIDQLNELSDEQKEQLREWWMGYNPRLSDVYVVKVKYDDITRYEGPYVNSGHRNFLEDYHTGEALPLLSIGQMIEVLSENSTLFNLTRYEDCNGERWNPRGTLHRRDDRYFESIKEELCDALWECVKKAL